ncbi:hypothetical protein M433DRAFT_9105 [Acidomyces richmondensis BFW]|nr:hypothetical protein M433DRAFT_9105 [Acidomyces richmondensis BFW]
MEMEIDSEGPTTPKRIIGYSSEEEEEGNKEEEEEGEEKKGKEEEEINKEREKEVLGLIYKARDLIVKAYKVLIYRAPTSVFNTEGGMDLIVDEIKTFN